MTKYVMSMWQPDGIVPPPEVLEPVMRELYAMEDEMRAAGVWVFSGGLHQPDTATVVRFKEGEVFTTDGPYAEGTEHIGGFTIVDVPDLDAALGWAKRISRITTLPIEVRPFQGA
ncbi:YciI family protein [Actinocatenispora rupis]|uniref:YCII-related domain-containing protein n=1 Tax=Actinocatenispora rupis TaxID=519421 RepID=A0A8J3J1G5_9ACTN|nr:YciI family protein [Actinocatenispora rupis]GID09766.1 hypothetical protein Aru02nite_06550 [Actinocatenispora rupis]